MMHFPDILTVRVLECDTKTPVQGVAISLELFARTKNNYVVGPHVTNGDGQIEFTRSECELSLEADKQMFIMDYFGALEDCRSLFKIRLHDPEHIERMIQQYSAAPQFWSQRFQNAEQLFSELKHVKNKAFEPKELLVNASDLTTITSVTMYLKRKSNASMAFTAR